MKDTLAISGQSWSVRLPARMDRSGVRHIIASPSLDELQTCKHKTQTVHVSVQFPRWTDAISFQSSRQHLTGKAYITTGAYWAYTNNLKSGKKFSWRLGCRHRNTFWDMHWVGQRDINTASILTISYAKKMKHYYYWIINKIQGICKQQNKIKRNSPRGQTADWYAFVRNVDFKQVTFDHTRSHHDLDLWPCDLKARSVHLCLQLQLTCKSGNIPTSSF